MLVLPLACRFRYLDECFAMCWLLSKLVWTSLTFRNDFLFLLISQLKDGRADYWRKIHLHLKIWVKSPVSRLYLVCCNINDWELTLQIYNSRHSIDLMSLRIQSIIMALSKDCMLQHDMKRSLGNTFLQGDILDILETLQGWRVKTLVSSASYWWNIEKSRSQSNGNVKKCITSWELLVACNDASAPLLSKYSNICIQWGWLLTCSARKQGFVYNLARCTWLTLSCVGTIEFLFTGFVGSPFSHLKTAFRYKSLHAWGQQWP